MNIKDKRIIMLNDCFGSIKGIQLFYVPDSPGWVFLQAAVGPVKSLYHLEAETNFDDETLGVK